MILLLSLTVVVISLYFVHLNYQYWVKRGVPGPKPKWIVGNIGENFLLRKSLADLYSGIYNQFENTRVVGIFRTSTPSLIVRDPELIREVLLKSFQYFQDNDFNINKENDPIVGRSPFFLKGEEWRKTRVVLTPGYSSGKMKMIFSLLEDMSRRFAEYAGRHPTATNRKGCDIKDICKRFTLNNVGVVAFGLEAKCFQEENPEFKQIADRFLSPVGWQAAKLFITGLLPFLNKVISIKFTPIDVEKKLFDIVEDTLRYRQENNIVRNDFLDILQTISKTNSDFSITDVTAHAAGFFTDAYETTSIVMQFLFFDLAVNLDKQDKLREEVCKAFEANHNSLSYEQLQEMPYLDSCMKESLRLHPALGALNKLCVKPFTYTPTEDEEIKQPFVIEPGVSVIILVYALHKDPKYFEKPESFEPERFFPENKNTFNKYAYLPFGEGPRACIGRRFGELQVKLGTAHIIRNYRVLLNKKTQMPLQHDPMYMMTSPKRGIWLDFTKIS